MLDKADCYICFLINIFHKFMMAPFLVKLDHTYLKDFSAGNALIWENLNSFLYLVLSTDYSFLYLVLSTAITLIKTTFRSIDTTCQPTPIRATLIPKQKGKNIRNKNNSNNKNKDNNNNQSLFFF